MDLRIQVPGLCYFSIELVLDLLRHNLWGFLGHFREAGYAPFFLLLRCQVCPSLIVAQSGGGDGFLFRPSKIPFLNVARHWSPLASASGSVALSWTLIIPLLCYYVKFLYSIIYLYMFAI